jgi:hypothetical protein
MSNPPPFPPPNTPPPPPPGGNPYGSNNPYGNNPYGNTPPPYGGNPYQQNPMGMQRDVPNATAVLVLGIISIVGCFCYGIVGLACGITALVLAAKALTEYNQNPAAFKQQSYNNLKAGRICAIIGCILSAIYVFLVVLSLAFNIGYYNQMFRF